MNTLYLLFCLIGVSPLDGVLSDDVDVCQNWDDDRLFGGKGCLLHYDAD